MGHGWPSCSTASYPFASDTVKRHAGMTSMNLASRSDPAFSEGLLPHFGRDLRAPPRDDKVE